MYKKRISDKKLLCTVTALLLTVSTLLLSSCSLLEEILIRESLKNVGYNTEYGINATIEDEYTEQTSLQISAVLDEIELLVTENDREKGQALLELYNELETLFYVLSDHCDLLYVSFCQKSNNDTVASEYQRISEQLTDYYARINSLYDDIYESNLSDAFYKDWAKDEVNEALALSKTYSEEFATITKQRDEYVRLYEQLDQDSLTFKSQSAKYYEQIVAKNREIARLAGAEDYPSYADQTIYGRDYTNDDIQVFYDAVEEYIIPLALELEDVIASSKDGYTLQSELDKLTKYDITVSLMEQKLSDYYAALGEDFKESFDAFGSLFFTAESRLSTKGAFTAYQTNKNMPICYFGAGYQTLFTYVHEQGHFSSFYLSKSSISSIDLCETHSQSNEWLYLSYAESFYDDDLYEELTACYLLDQILTITLSTCCDAFERAVYENEELSAADYDDLFVQCAKELGAYEFLKSYMGSSLERYWHLAVISNSMYYLSYAVSLIPSIEIFILSKEQGFSYAAQIYHDLCTVDSDAPFHKTIVDAALSSPFDPQVFTKIFEHFSPSNKKSTQ